MNVMARRNQVDGNEWRLTCNPTGDNQHILVVDSPRLIRARRQMGALLEDCGLDSYFDLRLADEELQGHIDAHVTARAAARDAGINADRVLVEAAKKLHEKMSLRDVAILLGYSHQYIAVLVKE